jgi:glycosyltransferase involved in cell wall biosynthesis
MSVPLHLSNLRREGRTHVLFMIDQLCEMGGAERVLLNTIRLLPKERYRCSLITFKIDSSLGIFESMPCPFYVFPMRRTLDWNSLQKAKKLRSFIRSEDVKIVHTFFETADLWGGLISKMTGVPALVSSRRDMGILRSPKHDVAYRFLNPCFDLVLTVSEEVRRFCINKDHLAPQKVQTLYNGLELDKILGSNGAGQLRASLRLEPTAPVVTTVGNIRRVKGIDILVETAAKVLRQFPNAVFLVIGRNSEPLHFQEIEERIAVLGIKDKVRFLGESENIFSLLKMSDVFFLPSRSEGFSNALIEAMACGLPCVATRVGGNSEAVEDGRNGYLVESEDADASADRILKLLSNPMEAARMGAAGREIVENKFTAEVMIQHLTQFYDRLLAGKRN